MTKDALREHAEAMKLAARGVPTVGATAVAIRTTGVCDVGERGVCYEVYERARPRHVGEQGYSFIFESGRYDGFSPAEVRAMLTLTGVVCPEIMRYRFTNVMRLANDFRAGRLKTPTGVVPARLWEGTTAKGVACHAFITRIAVHRDLDATEFERELQEQHAPASLQLQQVYNGRLVVL
jgi:hypothetical protein